MNFAMILQPAELTKIHYYSSTKTHLNKTLNKDVCGVNKNPRIYIKRNIFGPSWVLRVVEEETGKKSTKKCKISVFLYSLVFVGIGIALISGILFNSEKWVSTTKIPIKSTTPFKYDQNNTKNQRHLFNDKTVNKTIDLQPHLIDAHQKNRYCYNCSVNNGLVCLKDFAGIAPPTCRPALDRKDPTGCGGYCEVGTQYCYRLDKSNFVYQCLRLPPVKGRLHCPENVKFNCGNMCIGIRRQCDGHVDCSNGSDESNCECDDRTHFRCANNTSCLKKHKKCDGIVDCWDKSDEIGCNHPPENIDKLLLEIFN